MPMLQNFYGRYNNKYPQAYENDYANMNEYNNGYLAPEKHHHLMGECHHGYLDQEYGKAQRRMRKNIKKYHKMCRRAYMHYPSW